MLALIVFQQQFRGNWLHSFSAFPKQMQVAELQERMKFGFELVLHFPGESFVLATIRLMRNTDCCFAARLRLNPSKLQTIYCIRQ